MSLDTAQQRDFTWCWGFLGHPALFVHSAKVTHASRQPADIARERWLQLEFKTDSFLHFLPLRGPHHGYPDTDNVGKKLLKKRVIICFLHLLHHLRQVRRLCIPNGTSIHAYRLGWFPTACSEEEISFFGESVRWKFVVNKNVLKYFIPLQQKIRIFILYM